MNECKPLDEGAGDGRDGIWSSDDEDDGGDGQWLTLVHFSAQLKRYLWDRGCV